LKKTAADPPAFIASLPEDVRGDVEVLDEAISTMTGEQLADGRDPRPEASRRP
jgi:hypothetical protein